MLQAYAKAKLKTLSQFITIYQSIIDFSLDELWMNITLKFNKEDPDSLMDDVNFKVINTCEEYLKENNLWIDKFQLATIVMKIFCESIASLPQPFYVQARESKNLMKEYVKANKEYIEKAKKVKKENEELLKASEELEKKNQQLRAMPQESVDIPQPTTTITLEEKTVEVKPPIQPAPQKKKKPEYNHNVDTLADEFIF